MTDEPAKTDDSDTEVAQAAEAVDTPPEPVADEALVAPGEEAPSADAHEEAEEAEAHEEEAHEAEAHEELVAAESAEEAYDPELDGEPEPEPEVAPAGPIELAEDDDEEITKNWYILKVQSNRERSIAAALQRKVAIEGLDNLFGQILVPTEKVTEFKAGKKKIVERKLWPGYIAVEMHVNDDTWFAIRETGGIGDFTGSGGAPTPMEPHEIAKILHTEEEETDDTPKLNIQFAIGDKVKVKEGNFESFEGEVATIDDQSGKVSVMISIFGRSTPVELEYWQVETL